MDSFEKIENFSTLIGKITKILLENDNCLDSINEISEELYYYYDEEV